MHEGLACVGDGCQSQAEDRGSSHVAWDSGRGQRVGRMAIVDEGHKRQQVLTYGSENGQGERRSCRMATVDKGPKQWQGL